MDLYHDSRSILYREPFGACPAGTRVRLRLRTDDSCTSACVRAWTNGAEVRYPLQKQGGLWEAEIALPSAPGLFWYYFLALDRTGQWHFYGNAPDNRGGAGREYDGEPPSFQITLYDAGYRTPSWMKQACLYQVFPDRFFSSGKKDPSCLSEGCRYHAHWEEEPDNVLCNGDGAATDFFGGDLLGIAQKLPYLQSLGVTALYINPIFRARSNHKYDTGCYRQIDPSFGTEEDFRALCAQASALGIHILLDGVFSHTGDDSEYFDRYGHYGGNGAWQQLDSPYASWYRFTHWPESYDCWWGFPTLPNVNELDEGYLRYMLQEDDGVVPHWLRAGADGWRLDVADELPMAFLQHLRRTVKAVDSQAGIIGEVWEDASRKEAYGALRSYCTGDTLDGVMNYPVRDALIAFLLGQEPGCTLARVCESQRENYPAEFLYACMHLLGSHDKPRAIAVLSGHPHLEGRREERTPLCLSSEAYALGKARYCAALRFLAALPGMTGVYYGDEAGLVGMADPYCRGTFPWGREDMSLTEAVSQILTQRTPVEKTGFSAVHALSDDVVVAARWLVQGRDRFGQVQEGPERLVCAVNRSGQAVQVTLMPGAIEGFPLEAPLPLSIPARTALSCTL